MKLETIPVRLIKRPDHPIRARMVKEKLEELADSVGPKCRNAPIRLTPYLENGEEVFKMSDEEFDKWTEDYEGEWLLIDGDRRYHARKRKKDQELWAKLDNIEPKDAGFERAKENLYREDVSAVEEGHYFQHLRAEYDLKDQEIADQIGQHRTYVNKRRKCVDWPEDIKDPLEYGNLKWSHALILSRVDNETHRKRLVQQAVQQGATTEVVRQWYQNYQRRKKQVEERQKAAKRKKESMSDEERAKARDRAEQAHKKKRQITTTCQLHQGRVPIENVTAVKVCDVCWHVLADMQKDITNELEALDREMRYKKMEEEMEKDENKDIEEIQEIEDA